jgi:hypothetical protein
MGTGPSGHCHSATSARQKVLGLRNAGGYGPGPRAAVSRVSTECLLGRDFRHVPTGFGPAAPSEGLRGRETFAFSVGQFDFNRLGDLPAAACVLAPTHGFLLPSGAFYRSLRASLLADGYRMLGPVQRRSALHLTALSSRRFSPRNFLVSGPAQEDPDPADDFNHARHLDPHL